MVVAMAVYDQTPGAARPRTEGGDGLGLPPPVVPCEAPDWRSLYEQQRVRADALQARVKELTWAETSARSHAGMLKWNLARTRAQLEAAHGEVKEVRRDAQQSLFFKSQVARLEALLEEAGVETSRRSTMMSLRQDVFRLKKDLKAATAWHREVAFIYGSLFLIIQVSLQGVEFRVLFERHRSGRKTACLTPFAVARYA